MKIVNVCGARPNFMKIAPLMEAYAGEPAIAPLLVHTGQHYDEKMSRLFFDELGIPRPDVNLEVGSGSHALQTARIMERFEPVLLEHRPDAVVVVGDVNSTIACALTAAKLGVGVFHVEAGLRSFDRTMPEEINRVLTDALSDLLFVSEPSGVENLAREGIDPKRVHFVGNVMIDTLEKHRRRAERSTIHATLGVEPRGYCVVTLHRPANVDDPTVLARLAEVFAEIHRDLAIVFPVHPRTRQRMESAGLLGPLGGLPRLHLVEPLGYLDFLALLSKAALVLTDSGGIQEETTILGVPCLTLRENTERPVTITEGTNRLVGMDPARVLSAYHDVRAGRCRVGARPQGWDGRAAGRIARIIADWKR
ncbi:MAG: UDP-N-acetylglucosamine 2-epimerase (non-hydrolyzing) [Phycisphaerae bacterium]|jgi:UDP-N-acetylglucosamine 2-epimerase (non-hydrolysing)